MMTRRFQFPAALPLLLITALPLRAQVSDPVPEPIAPSGIVVDLVDVATAPPTTDNPELNMLARLTGLKPVPGDTARLAVGDLRGVLYMLRGADFAPYLDLRTRRPDFIDVPGSGTGFGGYAFHPEFLSNGVFYTSHSEAAGSAPADLAPPDPIGPIKLQWVVTEWTADDPAADAFSGSSRELLRADYHGTSHGFQEIAFNPNAAPGDPDYGMLYVCAGDGTPLARMHREGNVQTTGSFLGTILRIDPAGSNGRNGAYGIPPDNPYAGDPDAVQEIWTYGHRNPHRISWDAAGEGKMLIGDIGQSYLEEVNLGEPGANYGWPVREGTFVLDAADDEIFPLPENDDALGFTYPVAQYDHDEGTLFGDWKAAAIVGGYVYRGRATAELVGQYLFGDIVVGRIFHVPVDSLVPGRQARVEELTIRYDGAETTLRGLVGHERADLRFGTDHRGEVYVLSKVNGGIWRFSGTPVSTGIDDGGTGGNGGDGGEGTGNGDGGDGEGGDGGTSTANEAVEADDALAVYPNPTDGVFTVRLGRLPSSRRLPSSQSRITVYDALGQLVLSRPATGREARIDLSGHPAGLYVVRYTGRNGESQALRLVKR